MLSFSRHSGDGMMGTLSALGKIEVFDHFVGVFESQHEQRGHFLAGKIRIRFDGQDPLAVQSLGDPAIWRALAFRGHVRSYWEDLPTNEEKPFDRAVTLAYGVEVSGDRTDYDGLNEEVRRDLGAIDAWIDTLVARSFRNTRAGRTLPTTA